MNISLIPTIIISLFLTFAIFGFVVGWIRGFSKALMRFIMVMIVSVIVFFVVPPITKALLTLDISNLNIVIGDVHVVTVQDLVTDMLRNIPIVEDLIESSPTLESIIELMPQLIINIVLFVLCFFIFKWVSMIFYWIFGAIFFSKKKMAGKDKHNFIGAVIGAIQGVLVVVVFLVPFYGVIETVKPFINVATQEQQVAGEPQAFNANVYYAEPQDSTDDEENTLEQTAKEIKKYTDAFENNWVSKLFNVTGIKKLSVAMFDNLTTVENKTLKFELRQEVKTLAEAYPYIAEIQENGLDIEDNECLENIQDMLDGLYESPVMSGIVKELVPAAADRWYKGLEFCEIAKPELDDPAMQKLFDLVLLNLSTSTGDTVKNDVDTSLELVMLANDATLLKTITENGDIMDVLRKPENSDLISRIIGKALESDTLKAVLPEVFNVAMNSVYDALGIDADTIADIDIASGDVNWETETPLLQTIFNNVFNIYDQIDAGKAQGKDALESLDFGLLGETFDSLRASQLLSDSSLKIMQELLSSEEIVGEGNSTTLTEFKNILTEMWYPKENEPFEPLEPTFISLGKALKLAKTMQSTTEDFNVDDLGDVLTDFATNTEMQGIVKEVIKEDNLKEFGLDDKTAGLVNETISSVLELPEEELEQEIEAVKEVFNVANKVLNVDTTENPEAKAEVSTEESAALVEALAGSTTILDEITKEDSAVKDLDISSSLSEESMNNIETEINKLEDEETKNKLKELFGIGA